MICLIHFVKKEKFKQMLFIPIFENWFSTYTDLSSRKFYFNYLYWKNDYQRIIQEIQADLAHFNDKCCVVRREMLDCLVRSLRKIGNLDLAVQFVTELVQLEIVDLGSRVLASECHFESGRLDEALVRISSISRKDRLFIRLGCWQVKFVIPLVTVRLLLLRWEEQSLLLQDMRL